MQSGNDLFVSFKRTFVPLIVSTIIALAARYGLDLPADALLGVIEPVVFFVYYSLFRFLEAKGVGWAGFFLGSRKTPDYAPKGDSAPVAA